MATELTLAGTPAPKASAFPALTRLRGMIDQPLVQRSLPMLGLLGIIMAAVLAWMTISAPAQRPLFTALAESDKAAVAAALDTAGLAYKLDSTTGALSVADGDYHRARMVLAGQGLPKAAPDGALTLDSMPMGASHALENARLRGARETDLARTIEAIDAVESAKIHLAVEPPSLFVRDRVKPTASVMVTLANGRTLSASQVQAIVHLVASSVSGLDADGVSVVDQAGHLLSLDTSNPFAAEAARQLEVQNRVEMRYREALSHLLTPMLGADGFTAEVHADLDFDEKQATRETYPEDSRALRQERSQWTSADGAPPAVGIPGALSNQVPPVVGTSTTPPPPAPQPGATPPGRTSEDTSRSFELGREVSVSRTASGQVRRLSVAVALRDGAKRRTAAELAAIDGLVKAAVGFDARRGDSISVAGRPFLPSTDVAPAWWEADWVIPAARNLGAILVAAFLIFGIGRPYMKRRAAAAEARRAEVGALIGDALSEQPRDVTIEMIEATPSYAARVTMVRDFVRAHPERAAAVVRDLVKAAPDA